MYRYFKRLSDDQVFAYEVGSQDDLISSALDDAGMTEVSGPPVKVEPPLTADDARRKRNRMLASCDWTQLPDASVDASKWTAYRQALRDITLQDGFPENIIWPDMPN
jgi:hypothetical protein